MKVKKTKGYVCNTCGTFHEDEDEAELCCRDVEEVDAWECGECGEIYEDREEAKECCKE